MGTSEIAEVPLDDGDETLLRAYAGSFREQLGYAASATAFVAALGMAVLLAILNWNTSPCERDISFVWVALVAVTVAGLVCREFWFDALKTLRQSPDDNVLLRDLADGVAHEVTLEVTRAVEIEPFEDEGAGFFLELRDGRVLALVSQDLDEYADDIDLEPGEDDPRLEFPQTKIAYRFAPVSGLPLQHRGIGQPLRPFAKCRTGNHHFVNSIDSNPANFVGAEHGTFYDGSLEEVLERLRYPLDSQ